VAINYERAQAPAEALAAEITAGGGKAIAVQADVSRQDQVERMYREVDQRLGRLTALVNSAGIDGGAGTPVAELEQSRLERLLAVNVIGTMLCCREAVRRMSTARGGQGGAIVNVSSMAATIGGRAGRTLWRGLYGLAETPDLAQYRHWRRGGELCRLGRGCRRRSIAVAVTDLDGDHLVSMDAVAFLGPGHHAARRLCAGWRSHAAGVGWGAEMRVLYLDQLGFAGWLGGSTLGLWRVGGRLWADCPSVWRAVFMAELASLSRTNHRLGTADLFRVDAISVGSIFSGAVR
jgi:hypothetical protein